MAKQILLCTADRLASISDTVGTVTWASKDEAGQEIIITVPPQATNDRFIAGELALSVLAHIERIDAEAWRHGTFPPWPQSYCINQYVNYANDFGDPAADIISVEGTTTWFPPYDIDFKSDPTGYTSEERQRLGRARLDVTSKVYVAAGRMVRDIVESTVRDDLAGADKLAASAGDPAAAARTRWGFNGWFEPAAYSSLGHALRMLFGRLETGGPPDALIMNPEAWSGKDPECRGIAALELLTALPPGASARWNDRAPTTPGQSLALSILSSEGLVVPAEKVETIVGNLLRAGVVNQLLVNIGMDPSEVPEWQDEKPVDTVGLPPRALALLKMLERVSTEDLRFALYRNADAMNLILGLADAGDSLWPAPATGIQEGVRIRSTSQKAWYFDQILHGTVVIGGIPRSDLNADPMSRLGLVAASSQCENIANDLRTPLQNPFQLARHFRRELAAIDVKAGGNAPDGIELAIAELGAWAGELFIQGNRLGTPWLSICSDVGDVADVLSGELGVSRTALVDEPEEYLAAVSGNPRQVDCVAGQRRHVCHDSVAELPGSWDAAGTAPNPPAFSCIEFFPDDSSALDHTYIVARGNPDNPGRVLGYIGYVPDDAYVSDVVSPFQRELASALFGAGMPERRSATCNGVWDVSTPTTSCVLGVPREQFVPLANELTSSGGAGEDSWKHYLESARESAEKADALGWEWIEKGLEQELRREGAQEGLANMCGSFVDAAEVTASNGTLTPSETEGGLNECLNEAIYDVVFLTVPQLDGQPMNLEDEAFKTAVWNGYCEGTNPGHRPAFCSRGSETLQLATLALADATAPQQPSCEGPIKLAEDATAGAVRVNDLAEAGRNVSAAQLYDILRSYQFVIHAQSDSEHDAGEWQLLQYEVPVLEGNSAGPRDCSELGTSADQSMCEELLRVFGSGPELHKRVQAALWHMGALAGEIPPETFEIPVPVANMDVETEAQPAAIFGDSRVTSALELDTGHELEGGNDNYDRAIVGPLVPKSVEVIELYPHGAGYDGAWHQNLYDAAITGDYYLALTKNATIPFNVEFRGPNGAIGDRETTLGYWIADVALEGNSVGVGDAQRSITSFQFQSEEYEGVLVPSRDNGHREVCLTNGMPVFNWDAGFGSIRVYDLIRRCRGENGDVSWEFPLCSWRPGGRYAGELIPRLLQWGSQYHWEASAPLNDEPLLCWQAVHGAAAVKESNPIPRDCLPTIEDSYDALPGNHEWWGWEYMATGERLRPTSCPPSERVQMFVNTHADPATALSRVMALQCLGTTAAGSVLAPPPSIENVQDVRQLESWLRTVEDAGVQALGVMAMTEVPRRVVDDFRAGVVGTGTAGQGEHGKLLLQLRKDMEGMHLAWTNYLGAIAQIRSAVGAARARIGAVDLEVQGALIQLQRDRLELDRQIAVSSVRNMYASGSTALAAVPGYQTYADPAGHFRNLLAAMENEQVLEMDRETATQILELVSLQSVNVGDQGDANRNAILVDLNGNAAAGYTGLEGAMSAFRTSLADARGTLIGLEQNAQHASWEAAKAAGADFVVSDGGPVALPVNTVLNRQYNLLKERYKRALQRARRATYIARLAVEQRLGVRLNDLHSDIGPLPPPSTWAESLCTMQGVDYDALKEASDAPSGSESAEVDLIAGFADEFIGDYVDRLAEFVEFYNVEQPFKEGDDVAVVSLKNDVLLALGECGGESRNLLYHSSDLSQSGQLGSASEALQGWRRRPCEDDVCVEVLPYAGDPPGGLGGASHLVVGPPGDLFPSDPLQDNPPVEDTYEDPALPGAVYQTVRLGAGREYVLSWWDRAITAEGMDYQEGAGPIVYEVVVYDASWLPVAYSSPDAQTGTLWSPRRSVAFAAPSEGDYHVTFFAGPAGTATGSVAIANVQFEEVADGITGPGEYEATDKTRWRIATDCQSTASWSLKEAFERVCEGGEDFGATVPTCWWELKAPIVLDVELAQAGYGPLVGKFAVGNYNERHLGTSLNIVGTGVVDCSKDPSPDCYGSGYVEYDLVHSATNVPLVGYNANEVSCFDFAIGAIRSGKALATERYITMPLGAADLDLLSQPGFAKSELAGRPISGTYRLRIKDSPRLAWDRVEDIQLIMKYRLWSRVARPDGI